MTRWCAIDTETALIEPGLTFPPITCLTHFDGEREGLIGLADEKKIRDHVEWLLRDKDILIVGQNIAYDMGVLAAEWPELMPLIFDAYAADRVACTAVRQKLIDIASGQYRGYRDVSTGKWIEWAYSLGDSDKGATGLAHRHLGIVLDKHTWRLRYGELRDVPTNEWEEGARRYATDDAVATGLVFQAQEIDAEHVLQDQFRQARAAWGLKLISGWGIRTDAAAIARYEAKVREELDRERDRLLELDLVWKDKKGVFHRRDKIARELMRKTCEELGIQCPLTEGKQPALGEDAVQTVGDETLILYQRYISASTIIARVQELWRGAEQPIHTRFEELMESGRTSSSAPNIQNRPRAVGDRECFAPRAGSVFAAADYDGLELRTNAQSCIFAVGYSRLAEALNEGRDPHIELASQMRECSLEEAVAHYKQDKAEGRDPEDVSTMLYARQVAKVGNFGFFAGCGVENFVIQAWKTYGVKIERALSARLREAWYSTWPEMRDYHQWCSALCGQAGVSFVTQFLSLRQRGLTSYTETCNTFSQGLGADGAKAALFALQRACYVDEESPIFGCRIVNFVHDEFIAEVPEERGHECATEMARLQCEAFNPFVPDVPTTATPILMRRWSKKAQPTFDKEGRLVPWEPA